MEYRYLGNSGLRVSVMGLGTNAFGSRADEETSIQVIHEALALGINFLDTANIYSSTKSEQIIGKALRGRRHEAVVATKGGNQLSDGANNRGSSRLHLIQEVEDSLQRLQTDYIDLYQIHTFDAHTPLEETLGTLTDLVHAGKVRYIGASNYFAWELMKSLAISARDKLSRFISIQPSYSLADRLVERELVPLCLDQGVGLIPYFPLAGGILSGKYSGGAKPSGSRAETSPGFSNYLADEKRLKLGDEVVRVATELEITPSALSLAWLKYQPAVATVIVGATKPEQVRENAEAADVVLSEATLAHLEEISKSFLYGTPFSLYRA